MYFLRNLKFQHECPVTASLPVVDYIMKMNFTSCVMSNLKCKLLWPTRVQWAGDGNWRITKKTYKETWTLLLCWCKCFTNPLLFRSSLKMCCFGPQLFSVCHPLLHTGKKWVPISVQQKENKKPGLDNLETSLFRHSWKFHICQSSKILENVLLWWTVVDVISTPSPNTWERA